MSDKNDNSIKIRISLPKEIERGQKCNVSVEIINLSNSALIINKRLAIGYKKSLSRELFVNIYNSESNEDTGIQKLLYERPFSPIEDYIQLNLKQKISTKFNLFDWYEFPGPGTYFIQTCYQADEDLAYKPKGICNGIFCSEKKIVIFK